jgi:hypothetical protein
LENRSNLWDILKDDEKFLRNFEVKNREQPGKFRKKAGNV